MIYLFGFGLDTLYITRKTNILKEKFNKTLLFKTTRKEIILLLGAGILVSLGAYADKLIIFPLIGGTAVTTYYVATILGKTIAIAVGPITSVLLSYLAHMKKFSSNNFKLLLTISTIIGLKGYWGIILLSKPLLKLVYPQYVENAMQYIPITTLSSMLMIVSGAINPILLRFLIAKWQVAINGIYILVFSVINVFIK